jgi:hypothetical protein
LCISPYFTSISVKNIVPFFPPSALAEEYLPPHVVTL